jgi:hypothetical protein
MGIAREVSSAAESNAKIRFQSFLHANYRPTVFLCLVVLLPGKGTDHGIGQSLRLPIFLFALCVVVKYLIAAPLPCRRPLLALKLARAHIIGVTSFTR